MDNSEYNLCTLLKKLNDPEITKSVNEIQSFVSMYGECFNNWLDLYALVKNKYPHELNIQIKFKRFMYEYALNELK